MDRPAGNPLRASTAAVPENKAAGPSAPVVRSPDDVYTYLMRANIDVLASSTVTPREGREL
jgi:hypothetical protein